MIIDYFITLSYLSLLFFSLKLLHYLKQTMFTTLGEEVRFDENGDPIASYDLMNWQKTQDGSLHLMKVGYYDDSLAQDLFINESAVQWHKGFQVCQLSSVSKCFALQITIMYSSLLLISTFQYFTFSF